MLNRRVSKILRALFKSKPRNLVMSMEKSITYVKKDRKNPFLEIMVFHHSISIVMTNGDPPDGFSIPPSHSW